MRLLLTLCASFWLMACSPSPQAPQNHCLPYGRAVTLSGKAVTRMLSAEGGTPQNALLLQLDAPICVGPVAQEADIREIQLIPQSSFKAAYSLEGLRVTATGPLFAASTSQHRTAVLMTLQVIGPR
ncbi:MAG: DUF4431 domain-containing protein [Pseudomonadota bacterium]|nr:DUF4431 domain-containing protein [Pseudomonadota bacterium]